MDTLECPYNRLSYNKANRVAMEIVTTISLQTHTCRQIHIHSSPNDTIYLISEHDIKLFTARAYNSRWLWKEMERLSRRCIDCLWWLPCRSNTKVWVWHNSRWKQMSLAWELPRTHENKAQTTCIIYWFQIFTYCECILPSNQLSWAKTLTQIPL